MNLNDFFQLKKILPIDEDGCLNIYGFKIHTDDLLILTILFFLYKEKVEDKYLFIALILLLIS
jgi:hypothetical protein